MGITTISSITNNTNFPIFVMNVEHPSDTPNGGDAGQRIDPWDTLPYSMWIPWCGSNQDFPQHHIAVYNQTGTQTYLVIWQADRNGDDAVRFSGDGRWHDPGDHVEGTYEVNGNRDVSIEANPGGDLVVAMSPQPDPLPVIGVKEYLVPDGQALSVVVQTGKSHANLIGNLVVVVPSGAYSVSLTNVFHSTSGGTSVVLQPQNGDPTKWTTIHQEFAGRSPNGTWTAFIYPLPPLPPPVTTFLVMNYHLY
jgi:hypothetical protein